MDLFTSFEHASVRAEQDTKARFLQDLNVVVVGVSHGPAGTVTSGFFAIGSVDETNVTVHPVVEMIVPSHLQSSKTHIIFYY